MNLAQSPWNLHHSLLCLNPSFVVQLGILQLVMGKFLQSTPLWALVLESEEIVTSQTIRDVAQALITLYKITSYEFLEKAFTKPQCSIFGLNYSLQDYSLRGFKEGIRKALVFHS